MKLSFHVTFDPNQHATFHMPKICSWLGDAHEKTWLKLLMHVLKNTNIQAKFKLGLMLEELNSTPCHHLSGVN